MNTSGNQAENGKVVYTLGHKASHEHTKWK